jgi:hypothetical protein
MAERWHPSMGPTEEPDYPRDIPLIKCEQCGKYTEKILDHYDQHHPSLEELARRRAETLRRHPHLDPQLRLALWAPNSQMPGDSTSPVEEPNDGE